MKHSKSIVGRSMIGLKQAIESGEELRREFGMSESTTKPKVTIVLLKGEGSTVAFAHVSAHMNGIGLFLLKNIKIVVNHSGELFLGMPAKLNARDSKWHDHFNPATKQAREELTAIVLSAYHKKVGEKV